MADQTREGGGPFASPDGASDLTHFESAPRPAAPRPESGASTLAFEAAPRTPPPPDTAPAEARVLATVGVRTEVPDVTVVTSSGGPGWNVRDRGGQPRESLPEPPPTWSARPSPGAGVDRSAWMVPPAPAPRRRWTRRRVAGSLLAAVLAAMLALAAFAWATGSAHAHTITAPRTVGGLAPIGTPATAIVSEQMQKVMQVYGATRVVSGVYGTAGHPTLVVVLAQGPGIQATSNEFFDDFSTGLQTDGVTVNRQATIDKSTEGSNFVCSPATRPAPLSPVSLCGWDDGDTIGLVMDVSGQSVDVTLTEAEAARSAGEH